MNFTNEIPRPSSMWFRSMNKIIAKQYEEEILKELYESPKYICLLGLKLTAFIKWASFQRLDYGPDLIEEVTDFFKTKAWQKARFIEISLQQWLTLRKIVFKRDGYTCVYCSAKDVKLECDHIVPISKGGTSILSNLATACTVCNREKRNKGVEEFLARRENNVK